MIYLTRGSLDALAEQILITVVSGARDKPGYRTMVHPSVEKSVDATRAALDCLLGAGQWEPLEGEWPMMGQMACVQHDGPLAAILMATGSDVDTSENDE